mmetsp:Transcript_19753/g.21974  ORF Transcript_19753/g.21974 Transcript_19753/m.21974 type:complete len:115 (-) Transcript_19753:605-949(-)
MKNCTDSFLGNDLRPQFIAAGTSGDTEAIKKLLTQLPLVNRETLRVLSEHLALLASNSEKNKMTADNIGVCFGPSYAKVLPILINNVTTIFPETVVFGVSIQEVPNRFPKITSR